MLNNWKNISLYLKGKYHMTQVMELPTWSLALLSTMAKDQYVFNVLALWDLETPNY